MKCLKKLTCLVTLGSLTMVPLSAGFGEDVGKEASANILLGAQELSKALDKAFDNTIFHQKNFARSTKTLSFCLLGLTLGVTGIKLLYDSFYDEQHTSTAPHNQPKPSRPYRKWAGGICALLAGASLIAFSNK